MPLNRNIELKAVYPELQKARERLQQLAAVKVRDVHQVDTYFRVEHGRLKLRQSSDGSTELIFYRREDRSSARPSDYLRVSVTEASELRQALALALGVRVEVRKHREVYRLESVRIHLDTVDGLGSFIEFEAEVDSQNDDRVQHERLMQLRLTQLRRALGIDETLAVSGSYADLESHGRSSEGQVFGSD